MSNGSYTVDLTLPAPTGKSSWSGSQLKIASEFLSQSNFDTYVGPLVEQDAQEVNSLTCVVGKFRTPIGGGSGSLD